LGLVATSFCYQLGPGEGIEDVRASTNRLGLGEKSYDLLRPEMERAARRPLIAAGVSANSAFGPASLSKDRKKYPPRWIETKVSCVVSSLTKGSDV
jgi:hypothetical protein